MKFVCVVVVILSSICTGESLSTSSIKESILHIQRKSPENEVKRLVSILERESMLEPTFPGLWNDLIGDWLLLYTNNARDFREWENQNAFPVIPSLIQLKLVKQIISKGKVVNELSFEGKFSPQIRLSLSHDVKVISSSKPAQLCIDWVSIDITVDEKNLTIPLPGPSFLRRGFFDVSFGLILSSIF